MAHGIIFFKFRYSYGYQRAEVLGAMTSIVLIWILTGGLVYVAIERIIHQNYDVDPDVMMITAGVGVLFNIIMGLVLYMGKVPHNHHGHSHGDHSHSHDKHHNHEDSEGHLHSHTHKQGHINHGANLDVESTHSHEHHSHNHEENLNIRVRNRGGK